MPWNVEKRGDQWCVVKVLDGEVEGCHDTQEHARDQQKALYASERDSMAASLPVSQVTDSVIEELVRLAALPIGQVFDRPIAAGVAVVAADTGRVLMIQRALIDGEAAGGKWEFPGGKLEAGEDPWDGAAREFGEEVGHPLPSGYPAGTWLSADGIYRGFVYLVPGEDGLAILERSADARAVIDPENPNQANYTESVAWFDPMDLDRGPRILREECRSMNWSLLKGYGSMAAAGEMKINVIPTIDWAALEGQAALHGYRLVPTGGPTPANAIVAGAGLVSTNASGTQWRTQPRPEGPTPDPVLTELESLVASLAAPVSALLPEEPLPGPTPITLDDDTGTYDGHLCLWASCHIGYPGCVKPPREESFDFFNLGDAVTADGRHVPVGKLTIGCGHAGAELSWRTAAAHYDNSGTTAGVSHAIADRWGIRLPGSLVSSVTGHQIDEFRRSPMSGDWRRINSNLRLVAALGVNVPGYPVPRALVAGGEVQSMFVGFDLQDAAAAQVEADEIAESLGLSPAQRIESLRANVLK